MPACFALAANQSATVTPIQLNSALPYQISLEVYDFPDELPTLHSYNAAEYDGKWVLFAGRTNGLHTFDDMPSPAAFPPQSQNREVWVIDPVAGQSWHRPLDGPSGGLSAAELRSLTPTNTQFHQRGDYLYVTGGYGVVADLGGGNTINGTFNTLSAVNLPGLIDWVINDTGTAKQRIRQITGPPGNTDLFTVTGGAMYEIDGRTHLVFGQNFLGNYGTGTNGDYTNQVRSFDIVDDGMSLSVASIVRTPEDPDYRRRDLNVFPVLRPNGGGLDQGLVVLSGVFTTTDGAWTVPVEIDALGNPTMADPDAPDTFKQGFNGYHSAKLGLYSDDREEMHEVLFGGISLQYLDTDTQTVVTDDFLPFINDITSVVIDADGNYSQHWLGEYPELVHIDDEDVVRRLRFGANAEFFLAEGIETYENGVIKLDALTEPTVLGYIFGGLQSNSPHTFDFSTFTPVPGAISSASNRIFQVVYTPVPEPGTGLLFLLGVGAILARRRRFCR
jgi:hypothetical protein